MSAHTVVLAIHISAGSAGLVLGPIAAFAPKQRGRHTRVGEIYHWVFLALFISAVALAAMNWDQVWWLAPVGAGSYAFALLGYLAAKIRWSGWLVAHVSGQGGSYIAMVTALLVVNLGNVPAAWLAPTVIGTPLITWVNYRVAMGRLILPGQVGAQTRRPRTRSGAAGGVI